jgi:ankyrin repeat protein
VHCEWLQKDDPFFRFDDQNPRNPQFLLRAGRLRSLTLVTALVDRGTDVNEIADPDIRKTALIEACELGDLEMTSLLLSKGADVNRCAAKGITPLMVASTNGNIDVVAALLSMGATINNAENLYKHNALCIAISNGHINVVQFLLEKGIYIYIYDMICFLINLYRSLSLDS